jgi:hypothetical protein
MTFVVFVVITFFLFNARANKYFKAHGPEAVSDSCLLYPPARKAESLTMPVILSRADKFALITRAAWKSDMGGRHMRGILAIWKDCARGREAAYEEWYQDEPLIRRAYVDAEIGVYRLLCSLRKEDLA